MRQLLNTLYVTSEDIYLSLDGENVLAKKGDTVAARYPLHTFEQIVVFSYAGASPALMGKCVKAGIGLSFFSPSGRFLAKVHGTSSGNVLLRREQYRIADDDSKSALIVKNMVIGKIFNSRASIERTKRDHALAVDTDKLQNASNQLAELLNRIKEERDVNTLRGLEGAGATIYFGVFDELILRSKEQFFFHGRSRRPPLDKVNAMLSFAYSLLANDCAYALEGVGLDSFVGMLHKDRPGRISLGLDLMEELRPSFADRFVLTAINNRIIQASDFESFEDGTVKMTDAARKKFIKAWQDRKKEVITHPYLQEKVMWGLVPHIQALLLARHIRGDIEQYPSFMWK